MKTIAFDVMGNDNGVSAAINAVNIFVKQNINFKFLLVGDKKQIDKYLEPHPNVEIINEKRQVKKTNSLSVSRNMDHSMGKAITLVKEKKADLVISSGDSGTYLSLSTLHLKRLSGLKRPAFMSVFPTIAKNKKFLMTDIGANIDVTAQNLVQWAKVCNIFSQKIIGIKKPKVAIVNIGHEEYKGKDFHKEACTILSKTKNINFKGFVEPRNLLQGNIDIVISDGYAGNMILKTMEGSLVSLFSLLKKTLTSKLKYKIGALISKGAFKEIKNNLDYKNVGSAWVIGLNELVVKCHGSADTQSYLGAFNQIQTALDKGLKGAFKGKKYD